MEETILVEITIEGKKSTITITPKGCKIEASLDLEKLSDINSIIEYQATKSRHEKRHYQSLFGSAANESIKSLLT